jgi:L-fuconolactonase
MRPDRVVDAHVHFWQPAELEYPWLADLPPLQRAFLPRDHAAACGGAVEKLVFVEANCRPDQALREVRAVEALAVEDARIAGIVAFVDLTDARDAGRALDALADAPLVRGIRHNIQGQPAGFCLQPTFVAGVREAGRRGFGFDICITHDQLEDAIALARLCPDTPLVLDHCGKPAIAAGALDPWRAQIATLASLVHVWCKLSGLLTEAGERCGDEELAPYADVVAQAFGTGRLMYGSDWPVLTLAGTYGDWYGFTRRFTAGWSDAETRAFYGGNAARFYRL